MWVKVTSGSFTYYWAIAEIVRIIVPSNGTMSIHTTGQITTSNFPVTDWNNGRQLDATFADIGPNPMQV